MRLLEADELREAFTTAATAKFARQVPDFVALRALVEGRGGRFHNDHGAIRTADPAVCALFERGAGVLGLHRQLRYEFPAKKLRSFDLQVAGEDHRPFKIFVSQVDLDAFPDAVATAIREDCRSQAAAVDHTPFLELIGKAERDGGLRPGDADSFLAHFLERLMQRNGPPLRRATLETVAAASGEAASALALGPDFNHITIDVREAGFADIEAMAATMREAGFRLLPAIQGAPDSVLRQTATLSATMPTPVLESDGRIGTAATEKQFVEIIERNPLRDAQGQVLRRTDGAPLIFRHFLAANAEKIFEAAATPARRQATDRGA